MSPSKKVPVIIRMVNEDYGIDVLKKVNKISVADPVNEARFVAMTLIRRHTGFTFRWIAEYFNYQNARNAILFIEGRAFNEPSIRLRLENIETNYFKQISK